MVYFTRCVVVLLVALTSFTADACAEVVVSVATGKTEYNPGEAIDFQITARNTANERAALIFNAVEAGYSLDEDRFIYPQPALPFSPQQFIESNSSYTWTVRHKWQQYEIPLGEHRVVGRLAAMGLKPSTPTTFRIVEPAFPKQDFIIDFSAIPGSDTPIREIEEYWPWGVHFTIEGSPHSRLKLMNNGKQSYLACNSATFPPAFNIVAEFRMPVRAVSADVSAAAGAAVTMTAKDSDGNVLDSQTSSEVPELDKFLPLQVQSRGEPIAKVEWRASREKASVMIDNVGIRVSDGMNPATSRADR